MTMALQRVWLARRARIYIQFQIGNMTITRRSKKSISRRKYQTSRNECEKMRARQTDAKEEELLTAARYVMLLL